RRLANLSQSIAIERTNSSRLHDGARSWVVRHLVRGTLSHRVPVRGDQSHVICTGLRSGARRPYYFANPRPMIGFAPVSHDLDREERRFEGSRPMDTIHGAIPGRLCRLPAWS